jgi:hypothetical protein
MIFIPSFVSPLPRVFLLEESMQPNYAAYECKHLNARTTCGAHIPQRYLHGNIQILQFFFFHSNIL